MRSLHFLYHELRPVGSRYSYVTPCEEFEAHCALFATLRRGDSQHRLCPEITFDDGHGSDAEYAVPTLARYGLRARFFITAGWTGKRSGFMDWAAVRAVRAAGHEIGAHGMTHQLLTACSAPQLQEELEGARKRLEDGLGEAITTMSLPGGRANGRILQACESAGYTQVFTSVPSAEAMQHAPKRVGRLNLTSGTATAWLERVLDPSSGALTRLERMQRFKSAAQGLLGDRLYARVWALANGKELATVDVEASAQ